MVSFLRAVKVSERVELYAGRRVVGGDVIVVVVIAFEFSGYMLKKFDGLQRC